MNFLICLGTTVPFSLQASQELTFIYQIGTSVIFPLIFHSMLSFVVESPLNLSYLETQELPSMQEITKVFKSIVIFNLQMELEVRGQFLIKNSLIYIFFFVGVGGQLYVLMKYKIGSGQHTLLFPFN